MGHPLRNAGTQAPESLHYAMDDPWEVMREDAASRLLASQDLRVRYVPHALHWKEKKLLFYITL